MNIILFECKYKINMYMYNKLLDTSVHENLIPVNNQLIED